MDRLKASLVALVLALAPLPSLAQDAKDLVLRGDAQCTKCHDENDSSPVLAIGKTKHGTRADGRTPTCTSCHGPSEAHRSAEGASRPRPDRTFGKASVTPVPMRSRSVAWAIAPSTPHTNGLSPWRSVHG